jgi:hypothetical protein
MLSEYGQAVIDELELMDRQVLGMKAYMYLEIADNYKKKLEVLIQDAGI